MRSLKFHPDRKGGSTAAFQRIHAAFQVGARPTLGHSPGPQCKLHSDDRPRLPTSQTLSDADKRAAYDQGVDIRTRRGDDEEEDDETRQSLREEIERKYYPERYEYWPFGDPFIQKRKRQAQKRRQARRPQWWSHDYDSD